MRIHLFVSRDEPTREREWMPSKSMSALPISKPNVTHVVNPVVHFTFSDPSVFSILNSVSMHTIAHHSDASPTCLPGLHALRQRPERSNQRWRTHQIRRPKPKTQGILSSFSEPSSRKNRSGMNTSGLGYLPSSCDIALAYHRHRSRIHAC